MKKVKHFTKTSTFIFPLLGISKHLFMYDKKEYDRLVSKTRFVNAYIYSNVCEKHNHHVSIVIDPYRDVKFDHFYSSLSGHDTFIDSYEVNDLLIMVFEIPDQYIDDLTLIVNGKYSAVSPAGKQLIMKNHFFDSESTIIPMIFNKAKKLKDAWENKIGASIGDGEVWNIINVDEETLTNEKLDKVRNKVLEPSKEFE